MKMTKRIIALLTVLAMLIPMMAVISTASGSYTVAFNANTGVGGPGAVTTTGTLTIPSAVPTKDGMIFRGWATTAENAAKGIIAYSYDAKYGGSSKITVNCDTMLFAAWAYTVNLHRGNEGAGTGVVTKYKFPAADLELPVKKSAVKSQLGMYPKNSDQRVFIEWNTEQDSTTSKGIGETYREVYNVNANATLYAIWGYRIQYNADGGTFPKTGDDIFLKYVCGYDDNNYQNPKTLYGNFDLPEGSNKPVKSGCRLYTMSDGRVFYGLLRSDMSFFTTETAKQNLTIPPTGGKLPWSAFHTTTCEYGDTAIEFYAIWEPSVTYKANGGVGEDVVEYIEWDWDALHVYNSYYVKGEIFTKEGATLTGWNTKPDGSGKSYSIGKNIGGDRGNSDPVVLYAQWTDKVYVDVIEKYAVKYDANGGTPTPAAQTKTEDVDLKLTTDIPKRTGYIFEGWSENKNADVPTYLAGSVYTKNKGVTLYAVWEEMAKHTYNTVYDPAPTCTSDGVAYHTCIQCGFNYVEGLMALPHAYGQWADDGRGHSTRACADCGYTDTKNNEYTVTYMNMADGEFGKNTPTTHTFGTETKLVDPTRAGYTFGGWYLENGTKVTTLKANAYLGNITLYAKWNANSYKITYKDYNNATLSGTLGKDTPTTHAYGSVTELVPAEKKGYSFVGWYTDKACTKLVTEIAADAYTAAFTLYAKWEVCSYDIEYYDLGGYDFSGTYGKSTPVSYTYTAKTTLVNPTKTGYTFGGWYTEAGAKVTTLAAKAFTDTIRLYARWNPISYTITYKDQNNASFTGKLPTGYAAKHTYDVDTVLPVPTRAGYTFMGWHSDKACTKAIDTITACSIRSNITVYAKWQVNPRSINYYDMGGEAFSGTFSKTAPTEYKYSAAVTLINPTKTGYTFGGWYLENGTKVTSLAKGKYTEDIDLYAKWTANTYTITYKDQNNASFTGKLPTGYAIKHTYDVVTVLPIPTKTGYTFIGWYTDKACTKAIDTIEACSITANVTVYAKWEVNPCVIRYYDMGGDTFSGEFAKEAPTEYKYSAAVTLINPTKTGYTFGGWYLENGTKVTSLAKGKYTEDIDLYAKWTANKYSITYKDYNNASFSGKLATGYPTKHTYDVATVLPIPTKTGYTFIGWYTDKACTKAIDTIEACSITANITVYAKWEVNTYNIIYLNSLTQDFVLPAKAPNTYTYTKAVTLVNPTMEGYTFLGWYTEAGKKVTSLSAKTYTDDIVLTAKWKEK
ncbi:MAG: InlB B-repeat-containing protein [Clostridia bacterium]|nr:InlB B-repeat-containing protein [Clostridia bacterium]